MYYWIYPCGTLLFTRNGKYREGIQYNTKTQLLLLFYLTKHTNIEQQHAIMNNTSKQASALCPSKYKNKIQSSQE